ncbi:STM3941 family protein [Pediococcus siamensis]|uniref:STM3941 family protein n=1 Tax=Pediococcus siamensis TaxID=381829 RepID=UPI0039A09C9E
MKHYRRPTAYNTGNPAKASFRNLPINIFLAIYIFVLAVIVPTLFLSAILIGGQQFNAPLLMTMAAGFFGILLSLIALFKSKKQQLKTSGQILALIGTIMVATGILMVAFFIIVPLFLVADWFLLRPRKTAISSLEVPSPHSEYATSYADQKKQLKQLPNLKGSLNLPFSFYFNTDFILKLIPAVCLSTIGIYVSLWFNTRSRALPGTTAPMFLSMGLILILFILIDLVTWLIWKKVGRPIMTLDQSGIYYRNRRHPSFVPWHDIDRFTVVTLPHGSQSVTCLFVFAKNPEQYLAPVPPTSDRKEKFERWLHGLYPEYFQNQFAGVVLVIPINHLGIRSQQLLQLVSNVWKQYRV